MSEVKACVSFNGHELHLKRRDTISLKLPRFGFKERNNSEQEW